MDFMAERRLKLGREIMCDWQDVFQCLPIYLFTVGLCHILRFLFNSPLGN